MDIKRLLMMAVRSGCLCSILYHGLMLVTGKPITVAQVAIFTVVFIVLYFLWLVLVTKKKR